MCKFALYTWSIHTFFPGHPGFRKFILHFCGIIPEFHSSVACHGQSLILDKHLYTIVMVGLCIYIYIMSSFAGYFVML